MSKTIVLFDSWSFGFKFFEYYVYYLKQAGFNVVFATMDSVQFRTLSTDKSEELKAYSNTVREIVDCYDVSSEDAMEAFRQLYPNPSVIVNLSISHLENRLINLVFRGKSVIAYVQHGNIFGIEGAKNTVRSQSKLRAILSKSFIFKLQKIYKLFDLYRKFSNFSEFFSLLIQWLSGPREFVWLPRKHVSLHIDMAFSFSEGEADSLQRIYGLSKVQTKVIVNPEIFRLSDSIIPGKKRLSKVVFVDQALVESELLSEKQQHMDYSIVSNICKNLGISFSIRAHPRTDKSRLIGCYEVDQDSIEQLASNHNVFIGYNSSLLKSMASLGKPVIHMCFYDDYRSETVFSDSEMKSGEYKYYRSSHERDVASSIKYLYDQGWNEGGDTIRDPGHEVSNVLSLLDLKK